MTRRKSPAPSHFSKKNRFLQLAWDATSLNTFMECPRKYYYSLIRGFRGSKIDLDFGIMFASAVEVFWKAVLADQTREAATLAATEYVLKASWPKAAKQPWGGQYVQAWRCTGTEPYKNAAGHRAKCPHSHVGKWEFGEHPSTCGECGSAIEEVRRYEPENQKKNRITLIRAVVWYCLEQPVVGGFQPVRFKDGTPAVELPVRLPLPMELSTGERPILCAYFDRLAVLGSGAIGDEVFIADNKTTGGALNQAYWDKWSVNVQFDTYDLLGSLCFPDMNIRGVLNDAVQMLVGGVHFAKRQFYGTEGRRQEHLQIIEQTIWEADEAAAVALKRSTECHPVGAGVELAYPMRKSSCALCPFKKVCNKDPAVRERYLTNGDFGPGGNLWNPLEER